MDNDNPAASTPFDVPKRLPRFGEVTPAASEAAFKEVLGVPFELIALHAMKCAMKLTRGNRAEAEDLVQDAFVRILGATYKKPVRNALGWVTRIVDRLYIDTLRRRQTQTDKLGVRTGYEIALNEDVSDRISDDLANTVINLEAQSVFSAAFCDRITTLLNSLPKEDQRTVLRAMLDLDDGEIRSGKEIEGLTGFSEPKVKRLRAQLMPLLVNALTDLDDQSNPGEIA
mgnify:CR=1 FL=1